MARRGTIKVGRGKFRFNAKTLVRQEKELMQIYRMLADDTINTTKSSPGDTARWIARTILLEKYDQFDFATRLEEIIKMNGSL